MNKGVTKPKQMNKPKGLLLTLLYLTEKGRDSSRRSKETRMFSTKVETPRFRRYAINKLLRIN